MKTKIKIIMIAIAIISTIIGIGLTNSRYFSQVELVGDFEVATAIIDIEEQKEEIEKLLPGDTFEYCFTVNNYDEEGNLNELLMSYSIEIETLDSNVLPLEYKIYEIQEDGTTVEITNSNNTFELPYCNSESDKSTRNFKIVFTWDAEKNEAETYADKTYTFKVKAVATYSNYTKTAESKEITVYSKPYQELEVSIEETDETNVYNVTITNNNDYDVKCSISLDSDEFEMECEEIEDGYLTVKTEKTNVIFQIKIYEITETFDGIYYITESKVTEKEVEICVEIEISGPYRGQNYKQNLSAKKLRKILTANEIYNEFQIYGGSIVQILDGTQTKLYLADQDSIYVFFYNGLEKSETPEKNGYGVSGSWSTNGEKIYFESSLLNQYTGYMGVSAYTIKDWNTTLLYNWDDELKTTPACKATAYLLDNVLWSEIYDKDGTTFEWVIGGPTIEHFVSAANLLMGRDIMNYGVDDMRIRNCGGLDL